MNNTSDFAAKKMSGEKVFVEWEKYDTDPTEVDDAEVRNPAYDKRAEVRIRHTEAFQTGIRDHVLWKLAPDSSTGAKKAKGAVSANPKSVYRTRAYGLADRIENYGFGAIVSGINKQEAGNEQ